MSFKIYLINTLKTDYYTGGLLKNFENDYKLKTIQNFKTVVIYKIIFVFL